MKILRMQHKKRVIFYTEVLGQIKASRLLNKTEVESVELVKTLGNTKFCSSTINYIQLLVTPLPSLKDLIIGLVM